MNKAIKIGGGVLAGLMLIGACAPASTDESVDTATEVVEVVEAIEVIEAESITEPAPEVEAEVVEEVAPAMTVSQEQAIGSAESYLDFSNFSKKGLVEQLEFEDFSTEDATFAVQHLDVDWNEQAAESAESYLSFSNFSRQGLIEQLQFEGFTDAQAAHGADSVGL